MCRVFHNLAFCCASGTFAWGGCVAVGLGWGVCACGDGVGVGGGGDEGGFRDEEAEGLDYEDAGGLEVGGTGVVGGVCSAVATLDVDVFFYASVMGYEVGEGVGL